jgi:hypothetical protein
VSWAPVELGRRSVELGAGRAGRRAGRAERRSRPRKMIFESFRGPRERVQNVSKLPGRSKCLRRAELRSGRRDSKASWGLIRSQPPPVPSLSGEHLAESGQQASHELAAAEPVPSHLN